MIGELVEIGADPHDKQAEQMIAQGKIPPPTEALSEGGGGGACSTEVNGEGGEDGRAAESFQHLYNFITHFFHRRVGGVGLKHQVSC